VADQAQLPEGEEQKQEGSSKKGMMKMLIIILPVLLVLIVGGFFAYKMFLGGESAEAEKEKPVVPPPIINLSPFVVNLSDEGDYPRYLKVEFGLELRAGSNPEEVDERMPELRDVIIVLLSSKRSKDINTIEGKDRLRDEIITRINGRLTEAIVGRIFFKEFIIQ
jgi:flagellar FliL protein